MKGGQNCWEFKQCGREVGGACAERLGVCPAAEAAFADGLNSGKNGGRMCWALVGIYSGKKPMAKSAVREFHCITCDFFELVQREEGLDNFDILTPIQKHQYILELHDKRKCMRFDLRLAVALKNQNREADYLFGSTRNISREGFGLCIPDTCVYSKKQIKFEVKHPRKKIFVSASGDIVWKRRVGDRCLSGIKLTDAEEEFERGILDYAYDIWIEGAVFFQKQEGTRREGF